MSAALSPVAKVWRKKGVGLTITAKGAKDLAVGKRLHVLVAIAYGKGVVLREDYDKMMVFFAEFIIEHFNSCFARCGTKLNDQRIFVMDNYPSQTSKASLNAIDRIGAKFHDIPPRSQI